jgi:hypothetical protein
MVSSRGRRRHDRIHQQFPHIFMDLGSAVHNEVNYAVFVYLLKHKLATD